MTRSVLVELPEGANGFKPRLAFRYDSHKGNDVLGRGWSLSLSSIRRASKFGVPRYNDHPSQGDHFLLGDDDLVRADNGYYRPKVETFGRIERIDRPNGEIDHWIVHAVDGSTSWYGYTDESRVRSPEGRTYEWLIDRSVDANGNFIRYDYISLNSTTVSNILLPRTILYSFRGDGGEALGSPMPYEGTAIREVQFSYESRSDAAVSTKAGFVQSLRHRLDRIRILHSGNWFGEYDPTYYGEPGTPAPERTISLLAQIRRPGQSGIGHDLPTEKYRYAMLDIPDYQSTGNRADAFSEFFSTINLGDPQWRLLDVNGDSAPDAIFAATGSTESRIYLNTKGAEGAFGFYAPLTENSPAFSLPSVNTGVRISADEFETDVFRTFPTNSEAGKWVDYDGDGKVDLVYGYQESVELAGGCGGAACQFLCGDQSCSRDIRQTHRNLGWNWAPESSLGSGYQTLPAPISIVKQCVLIDPANNVTGSIPITYGYGKFIDVNGDGLADLLSHRIPNPDAITCLTASGFLQAGTWPAQFSTREVYLNNGNGWNSSPDPSWSARLGEMITESGLFLTQFIPFRLGGDRLVDMGIDGDGDGQIGAQSLEHQTTVYHLSGNPNDGWRRTLLPSHQIRPVDIDGDGLVDDLQENPGFNEGNGYRRIGSIPWAATLGSQDRTIDLDGDGFVDHIRADGNEATAHVSGDDPDLEPFGLLSKIILPMGGTISIDYGLSSGGSCYDTAPGGCNVTFTTEPGESLTDCSPPFFPASSDPATGVQFDPDGDLCGFPVQTLPFRVATVRRMESDDGAGNIRSESFAYDRGLFDPADREFRGFGLVTRIHAEDTYPSPKTGETITTGTIESTQFYVQNYMRGRPAQVDTFDRTGQLLERNIGLYFTTRASDDQTYLLQGLSYQAACDLNESTGVPSCPGLLNVDDIDLSFLPSPLPFHRFRSAFSAGNRDRARASIVLDAGSTSLLYDGSPTPVVLHTTRYPDRHGNTQLEIYLGDVSDPRDDRAELAAYAEPVCYEGMGPNAECFPSTLPKNRIRLPSGASSLAVASGGELLALTLLTRDYDGLENGWLTKGNVTQQREGIGADTVFVDYSYGEQTFGMAQSVSDPYSSGAALHWKVLQHDPSQSYATRITHGGQFSTEVEFDALGRSNPVRIVDANGAWVSFQYDAFGRLRCQSRWYAANEPPPPIPNTACGQQDSILKITYDDFYGLDSTRPRAIRRVDDGNGNNVSTRFFSDGFGRTVRTERDGLRPSGTGEAAATIVSEFVFDVQGRLRFARRPYFEGDPLPGGDQFLYDDRGRLRFSIAPDDGVSETITHQLTQTLIDAEDRTVRNRYDGIGQLVEVSETSGTLEYHTQYRYDPVGRIAGVCDAAATALNQCGEVVCTTSGCEMPIGNPRFVTKIDYDSRGRRRRLESPDNGIHTFAYDAQNRLIHQTDAAGNQVRRVFDAFGRLRCENTVGLESCDEDLGAEVIYTYGDEIGASVERHTSSHPAEIRTPIADYRYAFTPEGMISNLEMNLRDESASFTRSWLFDWLGRPITMTYPDGDQVFNTYDSMGINRISSLSGDHVLQITHDADRRSRSFVLGNGVTRHVVRNPESGRLERIIDDPGNGEAPFFDRRYAQDKTGRLQSIADAVEPNESIALLRYDDLGRLTQVDRPGETPAHFAYDPLGNLRSKAGVSIPYQHPRFAHAPYDASDPARFTYDERGNMTGYEGQAMEYDARGRATSISGDLTTHIDYNHVDLRVRMRQGADESLFMGGDLEIMNQKRFIKTLWAEGQPVARVARVWEPPVSATAARRDLAQIGTAQLLLGGFALFWALLVRWSASESLGRPAFAGTLALVFFLSPTYVAYAMIPDGDLNEDGQLNVADLMLAARLRDHLDYDVRGDVAPETAAPDGSLNGADLIRISNALENDDVDNDGLGNNQELGFGSSPFLDDTDGDGLRDGAEFDHGTDPRSQDTDRDGLRDGDEISHGSDPIAPDSDGDGLVDGRDDAPNHFNGTALHWIHSDYLGGVAVVSDIQGKPIRSLYYGVWGEVRRNDWLGTSVAHRPNPGRTFTGQTRVYDTGLMDYGARIYAPALGRFVQPDTVIPNLFDPQDLNRFAYVRNDPANLIDPTGNFQATDDSDPGDFGRNGPFDDLWDEPWDYWDRFDGELVPRSRPRSKTPFEVQQEIEEILRNGSASEPRPARSTVQMLRSQDLETQLIEDSFSGEFGELTEAQKAIGTMLLKKLHGDALTAINQDKSFSRAIRTGAGVASKLGKIDDVVRAPVDGIINRAHRRRAANLRMRADTLMYEGEQALLRPPSTPINRVPQDPYENGKAGVHFSLEPSID